MKWVLCSDVVFPGYVIFSLDVLATDMWEGLLSSESPELARLAASVHKSVIHSRADSMAKKYLVAFQ